MKKRKSFIFTNKKHSYRAIMSTILGIISLVSLGVVVVLSGRNGGEAPGSYGFTGLLATLYSVSGLILGLAAWREKDYYRIFPVLGTLLNLAALGGISFILYAGVNL